MNLSGSNKKILILAAGAALAVVFVVQSAVQGLGQRIRTLGDKAHVEEAVYRRYTGIESNRAAIEKEYQDDKTFEPDEDIPDRERFVHFLHEIEKICKDSSVSVVSLNPQNEPEMAKDFKKYLVDLKADASPKQAFAFLREIEKSRFLIKIDKLAISPKNEDGSVVKLEATLSLAVL